MSIRNRLLRRPETGPVGYLSGARVTPATDTGWATYNAGSRLFLPAATNYCTNPSFEIDTNADGLPDGWEEAHSTSAPATFSRVDTSGTYAVRMVYTGVADAAKVSILRFWVSSGFTAGDSATVSASIKGTVSGCFPFLKVQAWTAADAFLSEGLTAVSSSAGYVRYSVSLVLPATTAKVTAAFYIGTIDTGDTIDFTLDDVFPDKSAVLTPHFDGSTQPPATAWTGTANASTSTRAASNLVLTDYVTITSAGVVAAGTKVAYARNPSGTYYGPVVVTDNAKSGDWQTAFAAMGVNHHAIWHSLVSGDMLLPLRENGYGWVKP